MPTRYIYADLDALNQDVCKYMRAHAKDFSDAELTKHFPISAYKLTKCLSSDESTYFNGSYYYLKLKDVEAFRAVGWTMRPKSASKYRTLGHLPKPKRNPDNTETLVLVAGKLAGSILLGVDKYFEAGWSVHCYCFRDRDSKVFDRLVLEHPTQFKCIYLNNSVRNLIKDISGDYEMMFTARDTPRDEVVKSIPANYKISDLYEYIHELQVKILAMEADSEAQRTKQHDDLHYKLQQQQEAFAYQLSKHDEDFQERLREHHKAATFHRKQHEKVIEERVEICTNEVATALSNLGELSERVKHDVEEYQRARLDEELAHWRRDNLVSNTNVDDQDKADHSSLLDAVDFVLKQNGVHTGLKNWKAALVVLVIHKITAWLSSASLGTDLVGILTTSFAVVMITLCVVDTL
ncbi:hypothetical protein PPTG_06150 [Phytophthora nicotianae INRA-310]|uniref:Uncharacterized protein n=2 Tax=Phytophthora nicotianae TaxID=4792 RepID=W2QTQ6_PHYN3|nr:hypothetical protein PPTG_06150 [Phytophthora nicotianae INRA-310]ETN15874.1 hypothetical protein PPTG_06150 [Phytophthora nicotianae INRA-310]KUF80878.1 hypothetical protein AM587_10015035 [Phytophthora nicotianae]KUF82553.1 hypothetical protein AM587_10009068 [Phytophthora nicotianae]KUF96112.1 Ataxin-2 [Phytophthora nicotianae]